MQCKQSVIGRETELIDEKSRSHIGSVVLFQDLSVILLSDFNCLVEILVYMTKRI